MARTKAADIRRQALAFILLMGVVSLFSDMTHESASSILGAYLGLAGASAATIGFISGFGEWLGGALRLGTGYLADHTKRYWLLTIVGYAVDAFAVPLLALVPRDGWMWACALILVERTGKAIKKPAKDTLLSFAAHQTGAGKSFAIQEALDQIGAFIGPVMLTLAMLVKGKSTDTFTLYANCFALLAIPAAVTVALLFFAKRKFPTPEEFEPESKQPQATFVWSRPFILYLIGIGLFALGFANFALIALHVSSHKLVSPEMLPLLYSAAMAIDAVAALVFGWLFDRIGIRSLIAATLVSSLFSIPLFCGHGLGWAVCGVLMWGVGMGAQESILKSAVTVLVPRESRGRGFGLFQTVFGLSCFLGSWLLGILYGVSLTGFVVFSVAAQLVSVPLFWFAAGKRSRLPPCNAAVDGI